MVLIQWTNVLHCHYLILHLQKNRHACVVIIYATSGWQFQMLLSCVNNNSKCSVLVDAALVVVQLECVVLAHCICMQV